MQLTVYRRDPTTLHQTTTVVQCGVLESAELRHAKELLAMEQLLNSVTDARWHVAIVPDADEEARKR